MGKENGGLFPPPKGGNFLRDLEKGGVEKKGLSVPNLFREPKDGSSRVHTGDQGNSPPFICTTKLRTIERLHPRGDMVTGLYRGGGSLPREKGRIKLSQGEIATLEIPRDPRRSQNSR